MALPTKLRSFLVKKFAEYTHTVHPAAYTSREVAAAEHLPLREVAKCVVLFGDESYHMLVVSANRKVNYEDARLSLGLADVRLATEKELADLFPDCEPGAMPPMGNLYGIPVYLDSSLAGEENVSFQGGTHCDMIHMRTDDYRDLVEPTVLTLTRAGVMRMGR